MLQIDLCRKPYRQVRRSTTDVNEEKGNPRQNRGSILFKIFSRNCYPIISGLAKILIFLCLWTPLIKTGFYEAIFKG